MSNPNRWFAAITSAPRKQPTLGTTISSLKAAGFIRPYVYAEPGTILDACDAGYIQHTERKGVWRNWVFAVRKALQANREFALIVQDDLSIHPHSMEVLEHLFDSPAPRRRGPISVYTPRGYSREHNDVRHPRKQPGIYSVPTDPLWSAVGFAWRLDDLIEVAHHPIIESWRGHDPQPGQPLSAACNSDVAIGLICQSLGMKVWFPTPSFGIHTAKYSSIPGHGSNDMRHNRNAEKPADFESSLFAQLYGCHPYLGSNNDVS